MRAAAILTRVVRAIEALEVGDLCLADMILCDLEAELRGSIRWRPCPHCPATFRWPGEVDHHVRFHHSDGAAA